MTSTDQLDAVVAVTGHQLSLRSMSTQGYAPRLSIEGTLVGRSVPIATWLWFEPVPGLYATRGSVGLAKGLEPAVAELHGDGPRCWVYVPASELEPALAILEGGGRCELQLRHVPFRGCPAGGRLITGARLGDDRAELTVGQVTGPAAVQLVAD